MEKQTVKDRLMMFIAQIGVSMNSFEIKSGLSVGYMRQLRKEPSREKIKSIILAFPQLNEEWLLTGEGEMLRSNYTQNVDRSKNFTQTGDVMVNTSSDAALMKVLDELSAQRRMLEKKDEQIDRLISIIEKN